MTRPELREAEGLMVQLVNCQMKGVEGDAEAISDRLDGLWAKLNQDEHRLISGLSADLAMIEGREVIPSELESVSPITTASEVASAWSQNRWEDLLHHLRGPRPTELALDRIAYGRGRAWSSLGFHEGAWRFFSFAYDHAKNVHYLFLGFEEARTAGLAEEVDRRTRDILVDPSSDAALLCVAATMLPRGRNASPILATQVVDAVAKAQAHEGWSRVSAALRVTALLAAFTSEERLGHSPNAAALLDEAVRSSPPTSSVAWAARGLHRLSDLRTEALEDLREAVRRQSTIVWPYLLLAHDALQGGRYQEVRELASAGLRLTKKRDERAYLQCWWAIAEAWLGTDDDTVGSLFRAAEDEAPFDATIVANASVFRTHLLDKSPVADYSIEGGPATEESSLLDAAITEARLAA